MKSSSKSRLARVAIRWDVLQTVTAAIAALIALSAAIYAITNATVPPDPGRRIDSIDHRLRDIDLRVRVLEQSGRPAPRHPGRNTP